MQLWYGWTPRAGGHEMVPGASAWHLRKSILVGGENSALWLLLHIVDHKLYNPHAKPADESRSYGGLVDFFSTLSKLESGNELKLGELYVIYARSQYHYLFRSSL